MTDTPPTSKACTKCGVVKPLGGFFKNKTRKDGLETRCKTCTKATHAEYRAKNREKTKERNAKYKKENPEKQKYFSAKYHAKNRQKINDRQAKYQKENPEKARQKQKQWEANNPEKKKAMRTKASAKWRLSNVEKTKDACANWVSELKDSYVASLLKITTSKASPELLELKREQILHKRALREFKELLTNLNESQP